MLVKITIVLIEKIERTAFNSPFIVIICFRRFCGYPYA